MKRIRLDSGWRMTWTEHGEQVREYSSACLDEASWFAAGVPGDVHLDLMRAGRIPDPFAGTNTDAVLWMEQKDWWYRTRFVAGTGTREGPLRVPVRAYLVFHGLDCFATVYLNGEEIGRHANMFRPLELDVTGRIRPGAENTLAVRLASPIFAPLGNGTSPPTPWGFPRQLSRKAQMSYGWDIAPRLLTIGIWRPVELLLVDQARITDVWIRTRALETNARGKAGASMEAVVAIQVEPPDEGAELEVELAAGDRLLRRRLGPAAPGVHEVRFEWKIDEPRLWWPNGSGEPHLYPYRVRLLAGREALDERRGGFGVRTIELDRSPTEDGGHRFQFSVNGREIFMRGWNWTPPDAIFARAGPERRERLLRAAHDSGANMLRVWGGGVYEAPDFYRTADRLGLLIWQDFMFACSRYPQDGGYLAEVRAEAEHVVRALRSHPSVALWCGDNECDAAYPDPESNRITREVIPEVVSSLDPDRPYIPSSPHSPAGRRYNDENDSDVHLWRHGASYLDPYYLEGRPKFVSEIGYLSLPDAEVVNAFVGDSPAWPAEGPVWDHHAADALRVRRFRGMEHLARNLAACGRGAPGSLDEYIETSQELQAEAYRTWIDEFARRPGCSGLLIWNLCDCWPQMSDAAIAYPFRPKKAYSAVKEAFAGIGRR